MTPVLSTVATIAWRLLSFGRLLIPRAHSTHTFALIHHHYTVTPPRAIMSSIPTPSTSRSNLDSVFSSAFQAYKKKTGKDITSHPLAAEIQACHSPDAILAVLQSQFAALGQSQSDNEGSTRTKWLIPTINVLYSFSVALSEGAGLVNIAISPLSRKLCRDVCPSGILTGKSYFCGNRCSPF